MRLLNKFGSVAALSLLVVAGVDQARAQQGPLVVSPSQLTFNTSNSIGQAASQNLVILSNTGSPIIFTATASSAGNWLTVAPQNGSTPQVISVSATAGSLASGTYAGFVTITSASGFTTVPVTLNVGLTAPTPLVFSPSTLIFSFPTGATIPLTQQLNITGAGNVAFTASASTSSGANWLSISPTSGTTANPLNVTVNPTGLGIGVYFGAIAVNAPGTSGAVVTVEVNVGFPTAINVNPQQLSFAYQTGTAPPAAQSINLTTTEGPVAFTVQTDLSACQGNWIVVTPKSGIAPTTLSIQASAAGLSQTPSSCNGTIYIYAPGAVNQVITLPVYLLVSSRPLLQVPSVGPTIIYQSGTTPPAAQAIQVTSSSTPLPFTVTATPASNGGVDFVTLSATGGTTPQAVTVSINPAVLATLAPNTYAENLTFTSPDTELPNQTVTLTLIVTNNPMLVSSQQSLNFNYQLGQANPPSQTIALGSTGAPLSFSVASSATTCPGFLTANTSSGQTSVSGQSAQVTVGVNATGLTAAQTCTGTLTITPSGSNATPVNIPVTLNVSSGVLLSASPQAIKVTAVAGSAPVTQTISVATSDKTTALSFTAVVSTSPANMTWLSVSSSSGPTPGTFTVTIDPTGLQPGVYSGSIAVASTSIGAGTQTIPVVLTVASGTVSATPATLSFTQTFNGALPASQTVQLSGEPQGGSFSASATVFSGTNWLNVSTSGSTITVTPTGGLNRGTYTGVITVIAPGVSNSPLYIPVTFTVT